MMMMKMSSKPRPMSARSNMAMEHSMRPNSGRVRAVPVFRRKGKVVGIKSSPVPLRLLVYKLSFLCKKRCLAIVFQNIFY